MQILPNIQRRTYTNLSQTLSKDWKGGNTCKDCLWSHHYFDTKIKQRKHQKLQASIFDEYRCKNSQQNIKKPNSATHKIDHTRQPSGIHPKFTRMVQHTQIY